MASKQQEKLQRAVTSAQQQLQKADPERRLSLEVQSRLELHKEANGKIMEVSRTCSYSQGLRIEALVYFKSKGYTKSFDLVRAMTSRDCVIRLTSMVGFSNLPRLEGSSRFFNKSLDTLWGCYTSRVSCCHSDAMFLQALYTLVKEEQFAELLGNLEAHSITALDLLQHRRISSGSRTSLA